VDDSTQPEAAEIVPEHTQATELHVAFANGTIGEQDYDRALAGIYRDRNRAVKTAA
jgi:hypothetical protein